MLPNKDCKNCIHGERCYRREEYEWRNSNTTTEEIASDCFHHSRIIELLKPSIELIDDRTIVYYPSPKEMMEKINEIIEVLQEIRERVY